jgi:hypothetical protein
MCATCPVDLILLDLPIIDKEEVGCTDLVILVSLQLAAGFFFGLFFNLEDGDSNLL